MIVIDNRANLIGNLFKNSWWQQVKMRKNRKIDSRRGDENS